MALISNPHSSCSWQPNSAVITTQHWCHLDDLNDLERQVFSSSSLVSDIKNWLTVAGIPHTVVFRTARDHVSYMEIIQTTIQFTERSDLAAFRLGYAFSQPIDIKYY